jgi:hypothetical protein
MDGSKRNLSAAPRPSKRADANGHVPQYTEVTSVDDRCGLVEPWPGSAVAGPHLLPANCNMDAVTMTGTPWLCVCLISEHRSSNGLGAVTNRKENSTGRCGRKDPSRIKQINLFCQVHVRQKCIRSGILCEDALSSPTPESN